MHLHGQSPHTPAPRHTKLHSTLPLAAVVISVATLDDDRTREEAVLQGLPRPEYNVTLLTVRGGGRAEWVAWDGAVGGCLCVESIRKLHLQNLLRQLQTLL